MNIHEIKPSTVITRTKPANTQYGLDNSYISKPLILRGVCNGLIRLESGRSIDYGNDRSPNFYKTELLEEYWSDDWEIYTGDKCDVNYQGNRLKIVNYLLRALNNIKLRLIKNAF